LAPKLTTEDRQVVDSLLKLVAFLTGGLSEPQGQDAANTILLSNSRAGRFLDSLRRPENREKLVALLPTLREFAPSIRAFGGQLMRKLALKATSRVVRASSEAIFGVAISVSQSSSKGAFV